MQPSNIIVWILPFQVSTLQIVAYEIIISLYMVEVFKNGRSVDS
jgi:hypothetical protein